MISKSLLQQEKLKQCPNTAHQLRSKEFPFFKLNVVHTTNFNSCKQQGQKAFYLISLAARGGSHAPPLKVVATYFIKLPNVSN